MAPDQQRELKELQYVDESDGDTGAVHARDTATARQAADDLLIAGLRRHAKQVANGLPDHQSTSFRRAIKRVVQSWRDHKSKQLRDALPAEFSARTLRFIRVHACKSTAKKAAKAIECGKWTSVSSYINEPDGAFQNPLEGPLQGPFLRTNDYVCDRCKHPQVTHSELIDRLGLVMDERSWQRYLSATRPMTSRQLRRTVANALGQGWLGPWQVLALWKEINQVQASQKALRVIKDRVGERKPSPDGQVNLSRDEVEREFAKQLWLIDQDDTDAIQQLLQQPALPAWKRELLDDGSGGW